MINKRINKRNVFLWLLYDFANSIEFIAFYLYFSQWLVVDRGVSDVWFNLIFIGSTLLLVFTAPVLATMSDAIGRRMPFLRRTTYLAWLFFGATTFVVLFTNYIILAIILFLLGNFVYQLSFTFYNPLLNQLAPPRRRGLISGVGSAANWLGQVAGIFIVLPFVNGHWTLIGELGRAQAFLPATILFIILSIPMLVFFREEYEHDKPLFAIPSFFGEYKNIIKRFRDLMVFPGVGIFLLAYFFFNDALLTVANNFPIYMERVLDATDTTKSLMLMGVLVASAIGSSLFGYLADRWGLKRMMLVLLAFWAVILPVLGIFKTLTPFLVVVICSGLFYGGVWSVSRALLSCLVPPDRINYGFSFYTIAERFSTFVGPVGWSILVTSITTVNNLNYRVALMGMGVFVLVGLALVWWKVPNIRNQEN